MRYFTLIILSLSYTILLAQSEHSALLDGTVAYQKGDFETAEADFKKAVDANSSSIKGNFNLGNSLYKRQKYDDAANYFQNSIANSESNIQKSQAYYNLGNTRLAQAKRNMQTQGKQSMLSEEGHKHLEQAIDAYKDALRNNSKDYDAKNNLAAAYKLLRQHNQKQEQKQDQKQNQDKQDNKDNKQDKQDQNEQNKNQDKPQDQNKNQPIDNDNQSSNGETKELKKDEVDRLMEIIEQEDKKVQEKLMKRKRTKNQPPEKEW